MKARLSLLHKTEAEWLKLKGWAPEAGEIIIYDPDDNFDYARIKVGDGKKTLATLPFFIQETAEAVLKAQRHSEIIDCGNVKDYL